MKKIFILCFLLVIFSTSCSKYAGKNLNVVNTAKDTEEPTAAILKKFESEEPVVTVSKKPKHEDTLFTYNPSFLQYDIPSVIYEGVFGFSYEDSIEENATMQYTNIYSSEYGKLYHLEIESIRGDEIPEDRLDLGYFYVQQDKIYRMTKMNEKEENDLKLHRKIPKTGIVVFQNESKEDILKEGEEGWHEYIEVEGDKCKFGSYNNLVETGFYETFIWQKNVGLVFYQSGYGAGRESIALTLLSAKTVGISSKAHFLE